METVFKTLHHQPNPAALRILFQSVALQLKEFAAQVCHRSDVNPNTASSAPSRQAAYLVNTNLPQLPRRGGLPRG